MKRLSTTKHLKVSRRPKGLVIALAIAFLLPFAGSVIAATLGPITVGATILTKSNCRFSLKATTIPFGNLDPAVPVLVTASTTIDYRCLGAAGTAIFILSEDGGLNPLGVQNQMEHLGIPGQFLPYTLTLVYTPPPIPKNTWFTLTINGSVSGADYQTVPAGAYEDTVVISIIP